MSEFDIIRAWKDPEYRKSLTEEQRSQLPENPAGMIELPDEEMEKIQGGLFKSKICFNPKGHTKALICIKTVSIAGCPGGGGTKGYPLCVNTGGNTKGVFCIRTVNIIKCPK